MANDRLFIRCASCGDKLLLAKWWGSRYDVPSLSRVLEERVEEFLEEHWVCEGNAARAPADQFTLVDERAA